VVELLTDKFYTVQTPALLCIFNVTGSSNVQHIQRVVDLNVFLQLDRLLSSPKRSIRKDACAAIANVLAGGSGQIQAAIDFAILPKLIQMLHSAPLEIKKEACRALSNATFGASQAQVECLVDCDAIPPLLEMLGISDEKIVRCAADGLANMLRINFQPTTDAIDDAGGFDFIESLFSSKCSEELRCEALAKLTLPRIRHRLAQMCIGLHSLGLSALEMLAIFDELEWEYADYVPMHTKWDMIVAAKHFHTKKSAQLE
jgi:hypothetical protein